MNRYAAKMLTLGLLMILAILVLFGTSTFARIPMQVVSFALDNEHKIFDAELTLKDLRVAQIDEETGIRGYVDTQEKIFLEPYYSGKKRFVNIAHDEQMKTEFLGIATILEKIIQENTSWDSSIAQKLINSSKNMKRIDRIVLQREGNKRIDRIRHDISYAEVLLKGRDELAEKDAKDHVFGFVWLGSIIVGVALMGLIGWLASEITRRRFRENRLKILTERDSLTKILNRRGFEQKVTSLQKSKTSFSIIYMDLDKFKSINDTYGHNVGDIVLQTVGERLKSISRNNDFVSRIGGDEFAKIVIGDVLPTMIERIKTIVMEPILFEGGTIKIGISVGVARYPEDGERIEDIINRADKKMYQDKQITNNIP